MTTRTVVTHIRKPEPTPSTDFNFSQEMLPVSRFDEKVASEVKDYTEKAWNTFTAIAMPTIADEPWRRTDLKNMPVGNFRLAGQQDAAMLPTPPVELLQPLLGSQHAGQIALTQNQPEVWFRSSSHRKRCNLHGYSRRLSESWGPYLKNAG